MVPRAVASVTPTGVVDADGSERAVDVIVMATGFQAADYLGRVSRRRPRRPDARGALGRTSRAPISASPCPGFPNFFMIYGPGTNGGEIVTMLESQAEYAVRAVKRMIRERVTAVEVKPSFEARWYRWLQRTMAGHVVDDEQQLLHVASGKVVTQWPYGNLQYRVLTKLLGRVSESTRRRAATENEEKP